MVMVGDGNGNEGKVRNQPSFGERFKGKENNFHDRWNFFYLLLQPLLMMVTKGKINDERKTNEQALWLKSPSKLENKKKMRGKIRWEKYVKLDGKNMYLFISLFFLLFLISK